MAKTTSIVPEEHTHNLTENEFILFIRTNRMQVINKLKQSYSNLREEELADIFQEVCIAIIEKVRNQDVHLTCPLFYFTYRCCWYKAEHITRGGKTAWQLPNENILTENTSDEYEDQHVKQSKIDELLTAIFPDSNERECLLTKVCEVVKDLPKPCDRILYGMYSTPKKKQSVIAEECGYSNASVVKQMASRCKSKFRDRFSAIYESYKKGL